MRKKKQKVRKIPSFFIRFVISVVSVFVIVFLGSQFLPQKTTSFCANSISCIKNLTTQVQNDSQAIFEGKKLLAPAINLSEDSDKDVLGATTAPGEKHIYVDLPTQTLYAYQGKTLVLKTLISSGKWHPTPDGDFTIWVKLRATRMTGGEGADYYDLPNVPYVMFFYNNEVAKSEGFSLHGAYWHNNFGHPMSHGCVNMRIVDAKALYEWVDPPTNGLTTYADMEHPGTKVTIVGTAPGV